MTAPSSLVYSKTNVTRDYVRKMFMNKLYFNLYGY